MTGVRVSWKEEHCITAERTMPLMTAKGRPRDWESQGGGSPATWCLLLTGSPLSGPLTTCASTHWGSPSMGSLPKNSHAFPPLGSIQKTLPLSQSNPEILNSPHNATLDSSDDVSAF